MMSSSGFQHVNGLRLYVHRFRDESTAPSGLTIVLLHGFMDSGATWDMVAPVLARAGHDVVAPDLRGFGLSDSVGAGGYYHFPDYVADLAALVDALAPRRLAVVGHSMGGTVAGLYAGAHADKLERLALLEGTGPMATEPSIAVDRMQAWLRTLREVPRVPKTLVSLQEAIERLALHHPRVPRDVIESRAKLLTRADDQGRLLWAYDPLHRTTAPTPFHAEAFEEFLRRIDCPTLVVSGGPTGWHPPDEAKRIACLRHPVHFELPNAGHMMHWTEPVALAQQLVQFFGEAPKARAPVSTGSAPISPTRPPLDGVQPPGSTAGTPASGRGAAGATAVAVSPQAAPAPAAPAHAAPASATGAPSHGWPGPAASVPAGPTAPPTGLGAPPPAIPAPAPSSAGAAAPRAPAPAPSSPGGVPAAAPAPSPAAAPGFTATPAATAPPGVTATPGITTPGRPIYGGAAADPSPGPVMPGPFAGSVPIVPTRPSGGSSQGGGGNA
jgi:pimeloyl-ACP methyl ester carboxylesterase